MIIIRPTLLAIRLTFILFALPIQASAVDIPRFDTVDIKQWKSEIFSGESKYSIIHEGSNPILEAQSNGSASGLYFQQKIKISKNTKLNWRWKISKIWPEAIETSKAGDDYPARVYIVVSDGPFFWQKRTLVYAWSNNQPLNTTWPNAYTDKAFMWAVNSGNDHKDQWIDHSRYIQEDLKTAFDKTYTEIEAIAIMTDSDNGGESYLSWYDDISLTEQQ